MTLPSNRNVVVLAGVLGDTAAPPPGTPVSLSAAFNRGGVYADGTKFGTCNNRGCTGGGLDNGGYAYSAKLLGSSTSFNGVTYNCGAANANNDISAAGQTI